MQSYQNCEILNKTCITIIHFHYNNSSRRFTYTHQITTMRFKARFTIYTLLHFRHESTLLTRTLNDCAAGNETDENKTKLSYTEASCDRNKDTNSVQLRRAALALGLLAIIPFTTAMLQIFARDRHEQQHICHRMFDLNL
jgi:hypothetical protein